MGAFSLINGARRDGPTVLGVRVHTRAGALILKWVIGLLRAGALRKFRVIVNVVASLFVAIPIDQSRIRAVVGGNAVVYF